MQTHALHYSRLNGWTGLLTAVYAVNLIMTRKHLLEDLSTKVGFSTIPWIMLGDFNTIRFPHEKVGGNPSNLVEMNKFNKCVDICGLMDAKMSGHLVTWSNKCTRKRIMSRLDRALVNVEWFTEFPTCSGNYTSARLSDHATIVIKAEKFSGSGPKPFKFFSCWLNDEKFLDVFRNNWPREGNIYSKLKYIKKPFADWNKKVFGKMSDRVAIAISNLEEMERRIQEDPSDQNLIIQENKDQFRLAALLKEEEMFVRQKALALQISLGDSNTSYFYKQLATRKARNGIYRIVGQDGVLEDQNDINSEAVRYFEQALNPMGRVIIPPIVHFKSKISDNEKRFLGAKVSREEIKNIVMKADPEKAPGPYGFSALFFQKFWDEVGEDVINTIQKFFNTFVVPEH